MSNPEGCRHPRKPEARATAFCPLTRLQAMYDAGDESMR